MKKFLAIALCSVLIFALSVPAIAIVNISAGKAAITVDGTRDEAYGDNSTPIEALKEGSDPNAATGKAWTAWDDTYLYFYVEVYDKTPNHENDADNVEIMLDWNSGKGEADFATPETPYWQVRCFASTPNQDGVSLNGLIMEDEGIDWSINYSEVFEGVCKWYSGPIDGNYSNGYIIELAIAAPDGVSLTEGKTIPIEFQVCDNISGDAREGQRFLEDSADNDTQWNTPASCKGLLTLASAYVAAVVAVDEEPAADTAAEEDNTPVTAEDTNTNADTVVVTQAVQTGNTVLGLAVIFALVSAGAFVFFKRRIRN